MHKLRKSSEKSHNGLQPQETENEPITSNKPPVALNKTKPRTQIKYKSDIQSPWTNNCQQGWKINMKVLHLLEC